MTAHDDEILGKAYDARLMRRLLHYLRPYWRQVAVALATIVVGGAEASGADMPHFTSGGGAAGSHGQVA